MYDVSSHLYRHVVFLVSLFFLEIIRQARTGEIVARLRLCLQSTTLRFGTSLHIFTLVGRLAFLQVLYSLNCDLRASLGFPVSEETLANNVKQAKIFSHTAAAPVKSGQYMLI